MEIRTADENDLAGLLRLYAQFKGETIDMSENTRAIWRDILNDSRQKVIAAYKDCALVSTCVLVTVPNLTHGKQPYALIENVVTDEKYRKRGYGSAVLNYAKDLAMRANCFKIMLMTGSKLESTLRFYEQAGYNRTDKTAFIQWL